jgi:hypothetical protein
LGRPGGEPFLARCQRPAKPPGAVFSTTQNNNHDID